MINSFWKIEKARLIGLFVFIFLINSFSTIVNGQVPISHSEKKIVQATLEPFFIQYKNNEIAAENEMITVNGVNYFPLVDIVKMVNGKVNVSENGVQVDILTEQTDENDFLQKVDSLPKKVTTTYPTFEETVHAQAAAIIEDNPDHVLFSKNGNQKLYPASITKVMTALLAIENGDLNEKVIVSAEVKNIPYDSSRANIQEGDELTLKQLLHAMIVPSGNDAAVAVAAHIAGSEKNFVKLMNEKAKALGAINTNFVNPHGYHDPNQYTTAVDFAKVAHEAAKHEDFLSIVSVPNYTATYKNRNGKSVSKTWKATNQQIRKDSANYDANVIGGKTGFTSASRHTLVSFAKNDHNQYVTVILKGDRSGRYADTQRMLKRAITERESLNAENSQKVELVYNSEHLLVNNEAVSMGDEKLFSYNGRLYLPFDKIDDLSEAFKTEFIQKQTYKIALNHIMYPHINKLLHFREGRLFLPLHSILETFQFTMSFQEGSDVIEAYNADHSLSMSLNSTNVLVNGVSMNLVTSPFLKDGQTYVPIRFIGQTFYDTFDWGIGKTLKLM